MITLLISASNTDYSDNCNSLDLFYIEETSLVLFHFTYFTLLRSIPRLLLIVTVLCLPLSLASKLILTSISTVHILPNLAVFLPFNSLCFNILPHLVLLIKCDSYLFFCILNSFLLTSYSHFFVYVFFFIPVTLIVCAIYNWSVRSWHTTQV